MPSSPAARNSPMPSRSTSSPALKLIGVNESADAARDALADADALLVVDDGKPAGVLTRHDLLTFLGA